MVNTQMARDVFDGLSAPCKFLSSKYFYDERGDALFRAIMSLPEYYLTRAELEIFEDQADALIDGLGVKRDQHFAIVELGAGDGMKTLHLLRTLSEQGFSFDYRPVDISGSALDHLQSSLKATLPDISIKPFCGDYFSALHEFSLIDEPMAVLFLGSNIGNMSDDLAAEFLAGLDQQLAVGDTLLLGVDLIKEKDIVLPAYNDAKGVTAQFNLNVLHRLNTELGANFCVEKFYHEPHYSEATGIAESFLVSKERQQVDFEYEGRSFLFEKGEKIHTEISRKYNQEILKTITGKTALEMELCLTDSAGYFMDIVFRKANDAVP